MKTKLALLVLLALIGTMVTGCLLFDGAVTPPTVATNPPIWIQATWDAVDAADGSFVFTDELAVLVLDPTTSSSISYEVSIMTDAYETIAVATYEVGGLLNGTLKVYRFIKTGDDTIDYYYTVGATTTGPVEYTRRVEFVLPNEAPVAIITFAYGPDATQTGSYKTAIGYTNLFANESYDDDGRITGCRWDFGDGEGRTGVWVDTREVGHIYHKRGNYDVVLTVYDEDGASHSVTRRLKVRNI